MIFITLFDWKEEFMDYNGINYVKQLNHLSLLNFGKEFE